MTLGVAPRQADLFRSTAAYCEGRVAPDSIYGILHRECFRLFSDEMFADLFDDAGRRSVPPMIVAVVMVLQRIEGCSDREAVDRFAFDARWKYAAGGWTSITRGSCIRSWWTGGRGWPGPRSRTGFSRRPWRPRERPGWWAGGGCWIPRRCMTRWPRWTRSRWSVRRSAGC